MEVHNYIYGAQELIYGIPWEVHNLISMELLNSVSVTEGPQKA